MIFKTTSGLDQGPGSRGRVIQDVPFIGRISGGRVVVTIFMGCIIFAGGLALAWNLDREYPAILGLIISFIFGFIFLTLPAYFGRRRERWIVRNGTRMAAQIVKCERVGRAGPNMCYAIAQVLMLVELPSREYAEASVRRVVYSLDYRDVSELIGREVWAYWHPSFPDIAVPESPL